MKRYEINFEIGDWVLITHETVVDYHDGSYERTARRFPMTGAGQIVGLKRKFFGTHTTPSYDYGS